MTVLGPPWDVRLWLYPGADPAADPTLWGLPADISAYIRHRGSDGGQPVTYSGGRPDEASTVDPGEMSLTLDNSDGRFVPQNPLGAYYPDLDLNTPIRLGVVTAADTFTRTVSNGWGTSNTGNTWTVGGSASDWSTNGSTGQVTIPAANTAVLALPASATAADVDVVCTVIPNAAATGASYGAGPIVRRTDNSNMIECRLEFNTAGDVTLKIVRVALGVTTELAALNPIPSTSYSAAERWRIRAQADGATIRAKVWEEASSEPAAWTLSATDTSLTGADIGLYLARFSGNTNTVGPQLGIDDFTAIGFEFTGNVAKWPPRWDKSARNAYIPITAAGILRRLRKAKGALKTPLEHQLPFYSPKGYWTLQDGPDSTQFASAVAGVAAATFASVTPAADETLAGGSFAPTMTTATGLIRGSCPANGGTGFSAMYFVKLSSLPSTKTLVSQFKCSAGRVVRWAFSLDATTQYLDGYDVDGVAVVADANLHGGDYTQWMALQLETDVVGANTTYSMINHQVGLTTYYAMAGSFASTIVSKVTSFSIGGTDLLGAAVAHVWLGENTLPFVDDTFSLVSSGYSGELASARIARIAAEAGIPAMIEPGTSQACGPQRTLQPINEIQAAADADYGILYERSSGIGFRPRSARRNQDVLAALSVAAGEIAEPPEPIYDDQRTANSWRISRDNGSYAVVSNPDSVARVGEYGQSATINVATDDVLIGHGELRTYLGSRQVLRWPGLNLNFGRNPALLAKWRARAFAPRITVTTALTQVIGAEPDVIVEGYRCELDPQRWIAALTCSEAAAWDFGIYDDTTQRYDSASTVTHASYAAGVTSLVFRSGNFGDLWSTVNVPYDAICSGERVTVTVMGPDGTFEAAGLPGWGTPSSGTWARSTAQAHTGTGSGLLTVTGAPSQTYVRQSVMTPVTVGVSYRAVMWAYSVAGAANISLAIDWFDAGVGYLSTSAQTLTLAAATWTAFDLTAAAPASAALAVYGPSIGGSPAAGTAIYVDDIHVQQASGSTGWLQTATVTRAVNGVAKTLPAETQINRSTPGRYTL